MPTSLHPILAASDGPDLQQIIYVVVFLVLAFVQWVYKMWQEKREQAERNRKPPPSAEELEAKRRAWQQQAAEQQKAPPPMPASRQNPPPPASVPAPVPQHRPAPAPVPVPVPVPTEQRPGSLGDLIDTFRKAMEEQARPQAPALAPVPAPPPLRTQPAAPPLPAASRPVPVPTPVLAPKEVILPVHSYDIPQPKVHAQIAKGAAHSSRSNSSHSLTEYLRTTGGYRKAFVLKEVLDAPKALQKSPWPVD